MKPGSSGHTFDPSAQEAEKRQADFWVWGQPGLQNEFQDSQGYTEKPWLKKPNQTKKTQKKKDLKIFHLFFLLQYTGGNIYYRT